MTAFRLRRAVEAAISSASSDITSARALGVLALIAPDACLELLCDDAAVPTGAIAPDDVSNAVTTALRSASGATPGRRRNWATALGRRYGAAISAEAAAEVLRALGTELDVEQSELHASLAARFPAEPSILRAAIAVARASGDDAKLDELLTRLGLADRTPATIAFAQRLRPPNAKPDHPRIRAALLSSYTIDPLAPYLDLACRALDLTPEIYVAPFNSWARDIIDDASGLHRFQPDIAFLSVSIDDLMPELARHPGTEALEAAGDIALERVVQAARAFTGWAAGKPLVVHSFHSAFSGPLGIVDARESTSRAQWLSGINAKLVDELRALPSCYVLDVNDASVASGSSLSDNAKLRHLAAMRLPPQALAGLADAYARYIAPLKGLTRKCVVLDLDNTLWGGVVGEDGKDGIRLGNAAGSEFVEFQEFLRSLTERGILLAVNSKNNPGDALEVIRTHEAMVLRESDFSAIRINWEPKPDNMRAIAAELNIGIDSLVFVDDNPVEREQMRRLLPDVLTVEMPRDAALYRSVLERLPQLQTLAITAEDRRRLEGYQTVRLRERAKTDATNVADYLASLAIAVEIGPAAKSDFARIAQLFAKTNQFNVTTKRYDAADVERFAGDARYGFWALRAKDRFGDHGLVALALARTDGPVWTIDSLLMSCRVIGYGIETALLGFVAGRARAKNATTLVGEFVPTAKNAPARDLFERNGFTAGDATETTQRWHLPLAHSLEVPAWIAGTYRDS